METQEKIRKNWIEFPPDFDFKKYEAQGVDISLLSSTLLKTPTERAENNKAFLSLIAEIRKNQNKK